jgi:tetratricopeptide (TPR) repeat protein
MRAKVSSARDALQAICDQGLALHRAGRLEEARALYKRVLQRNPRHFGALHAFGVLCCQVGETELGSAMLRRAVAADPNAAGALCALGASQETLGRLGEALASYDRALGLQPGLADAHYNRAGVLRRLARREEALDAYETAVTLAPGLAEAHYNRGLVLDELGRRAEACDAYARAIAVRPGFPEAHHNRGLSLQALARLDEALDSFDAAIACAPEHVEAHYGRGLSLQRLDRRQEALAAFDTTLALAPGFADAHYARGLTLHELRQPEAAIASYDRALALRPGDVLTLFNRSLSLLLAGRMEEGWRDYETRLDIPQMIAERPDNDAPIWRGEPLGERTIHLHGEQGLGDTLQFCRYASLIAAPAKVILEAPAPLARLLASLPGEARIIAQGEIPPASDLRCSLMSLPAAFSTTLDTIPARIPYLSADAARAALWRGRLDALPGLKVGLVWSGGQRPEQTDAAAIDRRRSVSLEAMAPLAEVEGVTFVSLQKGAPAAQAANPPPGMTLLDFTDELDDFADTAALAEALDLVISVDTSVAHLAGAMGKPVWLLNRFDNCWRWLIDRDDSPWYPTLRQFRQSTPGDWDGVMRSVRDALATRMAR